MDSLEQCSVEELRVKLRQLDLPVSGIREDLIRRIREAEVCESASVTSSNTSSARARAAAKMAALKMKQEALKEGQRLEELELKLKQEKEALQIKTELAMATAEEETLARFEPTPVGRASPVPNSTDNNSIKVLLETMQLPQSEHIHFDGNPLNYWQFMNSFKNNVDSTSISDSNKLTRLLNCCTGKARRLVQCCAGMDSTTGYQNALRLLKERFGNSYLVAETWISDLLQFNEISANDREGLQEYADKLLACKESLQAMGYLAETYQAINSDIDLVIGQDNPSALIPLNVIRGGEYEPYATLTRLGWVINGPLNTNQDLSEDLYFKSANYLNLDDRLDEQLEKFWKVDSMESVSNNEGVDLARNLMGLLDSGGFTLTKWVSNNQQVLQSIPEDKLAKQRNKIKFELNQMVMNEKALGVCWNVQEDSLGFMYEPKEKPLTRRGLLSMMSSIYDPFGLLNPFMVRGKKLIQYVVYPETGLGRYYQGERSEGMVSVEIRITRCP
ncbi:hypothetical protein GQR58_022558 [Nymphon striatum]|nr:hypothetical protein GQR58_022558 [Nymphon striatum]